MTGPAQNVTFIHVVKPENYEFNKHNYYNYYIFNNVNVIYTNPIWLKDATGIR